MVKPKDDLPRVSIVIPTLNVAAVLLPCLNSIKNQNYPQDKIEIVVADGGSTDKTVKIAEAYGARVFENPLKTGESGKMVALNHAAGEYCALVDSDNILPNENWLWEMIEPLIKHSEAVGSEPWEYTWREKDSFITRYSALIGMNDPLVHFLGNYDRLNLLSGKWTEVPHKEEDYGSYILASFDRRGIPTIGANGTVFRTSFLKENAIGDYLFDIDILAKKIMSDGTVEFIKVKNGIVHTFCEGNLSKFAKKQRRRVKDYFYHKAQGERSYDWSFTQSNFKGILKFVLACVTVIPLFYQAVKGYRRKKDVAWLAHPLLCWITLLTYASGAVASLFRKSELSRENW